LITKFKLSGLHPTLVEMVLLFPATKYKSRIQLDNLFHQVSVMVQIKQ